MKKKAVMIIAATIKVAKMLQPSARCSFGSLMIIDRFENSGVADGDCFGFARFIAPADGPGTDATDPEKGC